MLYCPIGDKDKTAIDCLDLFYFGDLLAAH